MRSPRTARRFIWVALAVQLAGLAYDAVWHGLIRPGVEPATRREMAAHLLTVHLPLYIGVAAVLITTLWAFAEALRDGRAGGAWSVAALGALLSALGETWHAVMHLQLNAHAGAVAGSLSPVGLIMVAGGVWRAGRRERRARAPERSQRRAA
jgi:hypothetical protein